MLNLRVAWIDAQGLEIGEPGGLGVRATRHLVSKMHLYYFSQMFLFLTNSNQNADVPVFLVGVVLGDVLSPPGEFNTVYCYNFRIFA